MQVRNNLFEPVINAFLANGDRYNLLNSAVLELVDFVRRENIKPLVNHLVEGFEERLAACDYVDTFRSLKLRYEQNKVRFSFLLLLLKCTCPDTVKSQEMCCEATRVSVLEVYIALLELTVANI
jgi:protein phosphatase-4 regulatory subunit 3